MLLIISKKLFSHLSAASAAVMLTSSLTQVCMAQLVPGESEKDRFSYLGSHLFELVGADRDRLTKIFGESIPSKKNGREDFAYQLGPASKNGDQVWIVTFGLFENTIQEIRINRATQIVRRVPISKDDLNREPQ